MGTCPECEETFYFDEDTEIGDTIDCPSCEARLEILNTNPALVDYAPKGSAR